jgi:bifunctional UDP-N-acetylglucosamine pyrophosphorylase/glucosamine-1-phosphate N-acetyltransferase
MSGWTALIPAAGKGARLQSDRPKILYPVAGRPILAWLIDLLRPYCSEFVFVLSPDGAPVVEPELQRLVGGQFRTAIQPEPKGMGDAIARGLSCVSSPNVLVIWGDQAAVQPRSIETCIGMFGENPAPAGVCPTLIRGNPYIHFERDSQGRLSRILQAREGDVMPASGESDAGIFFFQRETLERFLPAAIASGALVGRMTREINFLPLLPLIGQATGALKTPAIMTEAESVGVNTAADAAYLEMHLNTGGRL